MEAISYNEAGVRLISSASNAGEAHAAVSTSHLVALSRLEYELIREFVRVPEVSALYAARDDEGVLMVFVVVPEHNDAVYQSVLDADAAVRLRVGDDFELRVRAHQGRNPVRAVPVRSLPLFYRDEC